MGERERISEVPDHPHQQQGIAPSTSDNTVKIEQLTVYCVELRISDTSPLPPPRRRPSSRSSGRGEGHGSPPRGTSGTNISNSGQKRRRMEGEERESAIAGQSAREARKMKRSRRG